MGEHYDALLAAGLTVLGGLLSVLGWLVRSWKVAYDEMHKQHFAHAAKSDIHQVTMSRETLDLHLSSLNERLERHILEDEKLFNMTNVRQEEIRRTLHWLGDCIMKIAFNMKIDLPERPE